MSKTKQPRILVVDDDKNILEVISTGLEDEGYAVDTAENGNRAIEKADMNFYNLALIDIRLPDMEGTELVTRMKEARPEIVAIILTGYPTLQNAVEALNNGTDAYLLKPVHMKDILEVVRLKLKKQEELYLYMLEK
jgi:DNA-binding response OmpR family regulator